MYAEDTVRLVAYLNPHRSSVDRQVLARLRGDAAHGKAASAVVRAALAEHYGLEHRPTLPDTAQQQLAALTQAVQHLTTQFEAMAALTAQVQQLTAQVAALQADNQRLRQLLLGATFGDKTQRRQAEQAALALVTDGNGRA